MNYDRIGDTEVELLLNNNYRENYDKSRCAIFIPLFRVLRQLLPSLFSFSSSVFFICFRVATVATKFLSLSPQILRFFRF